MAKSNIQSIFVVEKTSFELNYFEIVYDLLLTKYDFELISFQRVHVIVYACVQVLLLVEVLKEKFSIGLDLALAKV